MPRWGSGGLPCLDIASAALAPARCAYGQPTRFAERLEGLNGHCACRFCFTWTSHEPRLPEADIPPPPADPSIPEVSGKQPKAPSRQSKVVSEEPKEKMLLPDDHRTAHVLLSRWQQWMHCHGDDTGTKSHVHAKDTHLSADCKAFCPNGHYVMPNGRQTHGVYEGTYRELLDDMEALRVRLESVEDPDCHVQNVCIRCGGKCFPGAGGLGRLSARSITS
eukprot:gene9848-11663_t